MGQINELVTKFSFSGSTRPLSSYNTKLGKSIGLLGGVSAGMAAAGVAVVGFAVHTARAANGMIQLSKNTGVSMQTIRQFGYVATQTGSSVGAMNSTLESLNMAIGEGAINGSAAFSRLGLSVYKSNGQLKNSADMLMDIRNRFRELKVPRQVQMAMLSQMGIDPHLVRMMNLTNAQMARYNKQAAIFGKVTKRQRDSLNDLNMSVDGYKFGLTQLGLQIGSELTPSIKGLMDTFAKWATVHKDQIVKTLRVGLGLIKEYGSAVLKLAMTILIAVAAFKLMRAGAKLAKGAWDVGKILTGKGKKGGLGIPGMGGCCCCCGGGSGGLPDEKEPKGKKGFWRSLWSGIKTASSVAWSATKKFGVGAAAGGAALMHGGMTDPIAQKFLVTKLITTEWGALKKWAMPAISEGLATAAPYAYGVMKGGVTGLTHQPPSVGTSSVKGDSYGNLTINQTLNMPITDNPNGREIGKAALEEFNRGIANSRALINQGGH